MEISSDISGLSYYDKFRRFLVEKLRVEVLFVEIFSVMKNGFFIDVRYVVYGFFWYLVSKLDGIIVLNKDEVIYF